MRNLYPQIPAKDYYSERDRNNAKLSPRTELRKGRIDSPEERRAALAEKLREGALDCAIVSNPKHIFYLTGFASNLNMYLTLTKGHRSTSFLAINRDGKSFFLLGQTELSSPWTKGKKSRNQLERVFDGEITTYADYDLEKRMVTYGDSLSSEFKKWLGGLNVEGKRIGIEDWHLAETYRSTLSRALNPADLVGISSTLLSMRNSKGRDEIENLRAATGMLDFAYKFAQLNSRRGKTELDIYREMNYHTFEKYGPFGWIIGDHVSGERSLEVGGWATGRSFRSGDTVVLDLQASHDNYWSDLCRTFVIGKKPTSDQRRVHETLKRALRRAEQLMRPGVKGGEIYSAASDEITKAGYPKLMHHAGHSIGLDDQEPPWFIPGSGQELKEGSVCVVEPGVYMQSAGGIRIEDAYVITRNGNEKISRYPLDLA